MSYSIRTIVAGLATLDEFDPVLLPAVELAERLGATLHLVHALERPDAVWGEGGGTCCPDGMALRRHTQLAQAWCEEVVEQVRPRTPVRVHAEPGAAALTLQLRAFQEAADLVVVGATRRGRLARALLGTTAQRVIRDASAPVLVLREAAPEHPERVLLTTDLSTLSAGVHEIGLDVAETLVGGARIHARSLLVGWPGEAAAAPATGPELDAFLRERRQRAYPVNALVRFGDAAREITAGAAEWGAGLVVMSTHGRAGTRRVLLGSVAEAVVQQAPCNVLMIPATMAQRVHPVPERRTGDAMASTAFA